MTKSEICKAEHEVLVAAVDEWMLESDGKEGINYICGVIDMAKKLLENVNE